MQNFIGIWLELLSSMDFWQHLFTLLYVWQSIGMKYVYTAISSKNLFKKCNLRQFGFIVVAKQKKIYYWRLGTFAIQGIVWLKKRTGVIAWMISWHFQSRFIIQFSIYDISDTITYLVIIKWFYRGLDNFLTVLPTYLFISII